MADGIGFAAARAVERFATHIRSLPSASSSRCTPNCNIEKIEEDINRVIPMLAAIRARLNDAGEREIRDDFVRHWLRELEGVAYDAEDVLDEFLYEALRLQVVEDGGSAAGSHREVAVDAVVHKMEEEVNLERQRERKRKMPLQGTGKINSSFDDSMKHKQTLRFERSRVGVPARLPTSSLMTAESCIFGRQEDLEMVKKFLLSDDEPRGSNNVPVMAIVGMGGLGKTTLARLAYNDDVINKHFQLKSWVWASENFDLVRLTRAMVESFNGEACPISELDTLHVMLKEKLDGKRFLLVLDDVWEVEDLASSWGTLTAPLCNGRSPGSKIIITTRSQKVSRLTGATLTHHLPCLQDEASLKLISQQAFEGQDSDLCQKLMAVGGETSKKCKGLPLVEKNPGGLLHCDDDEQSNIWDACEESGIQTLDMTRATFDEAEKREITDGSVCHWQRELEGVTYAAEDVLDDFSYEEMGLGLMEDSGLTTPGSHKGDVVNVVVQEMWETVCNSSSSTPSHEIFAILTEVEMRIEKISSKFDEIMKHKLGLWFEEDYGRRRVATHVRQPTSSVLVEKCTFGREDDLRKIKEFLLDAEYRKSNNIAVIAVVGMGGLGKTALARLAYDDDDVREHFGLTSWVWVSENFDLVRLTRAMIQSFNQDACNVSGLDPLQMKLRQNLAEQRFLLVLDDVWEAENLSRNWNTLTAPLCNRSAGSKIIITTRSDKVPKMMKAASIHHLPILQDSDCLKLFSQQAFEDRDPSLYPNLVLIGEKISKKCRGLPLVAKTLGDLLHSVDDEETWNDILERDIWNTDGENEIMPVLRLSYQHLPSHLKRLF